jgi:hypothetical protein
MTFADALQTYRERLKATSPSKTEAKLPGGTNYRLC